MPLGSATPHTFGCQKLAHPLGEKVPTKAMQRIVLLVSSCALAAACASGGSHIDVSPAEVPIPARPSSGAAAAPAEPVEDATPVVLTRALVRQTVQQGIGNFLSGIELSPVLRGGRFVGFRIDQARALPRWNASGLAVRRGDVVTRINGSPIERPEQAQAVFNHLVDADAIVVDVIRDGGSVTLRIPVTADPPAVTDASAPR